MKKAFFLLILILSVVYIPTVTLAFDPSYKFTDQEEDSESGLYDFGPRQYNPQTGKFIQQDPALIDASNDEFFLNKNNNELNKFLSNPQNLNTYSYTRNNPISAIDPTGLFTEVLVKKGELSSLEDLVGHVLVNVNDEMIYGFAPTPNPADDVQKYATREDFENEYLGYDFTSNKFDTTPDQEKIIADYYESLTFEANKPGNAPMFDAFNFNCTQVAQNALREGNVINWEKNLWLPSSLNNRLDQIYTVKTSPTKAFFKYGPIKYFILKSEYKNIPTQIIEKHKFGIR